MYVLLGILGLSRFFSRAWIGHLVASRFCDQDTVEIGETVVIEVEVKNQGRLSVPWLILEDSLPRDALVQMPHHLNAEGSRLTLTRLETGETASLKHQIGRA